MAAAFAASASRDLVPMPPGGLRYGIDA